MTDATKSVVLDRELEEKEPGSSGSASAARSAAGRPAKRTNGFASAHTWNTFDTGGVCPACLHQWTETQCLSCSRWSLHSLWYAQ